MYRYSFLMRVEFVNLPYCIIAPPFSVLIRGVHEQDEIRNETLVLFPNGICDILNLHTGLCFNVNYRLLPSHQEHPRSSYHISAFCPVRDSCNCHRYPTLHWIWLDAL